MYERQMNEGARYASRVADRSYRVIRVTVIAPGHPVVHTREGHWATPTP